MFSKEEIQSMANRGKEQLKNTNTNEEDTLPKNVEIDNDENNIKLEEEEDIYAKFREEADVEYDNFDNATNTDNNKVKIDANLDPSNYSNPRLSDIEIDDTVPERDILPNDEVLYEGGPTKSQVDMWKKEWNGYGMYLVEIAEQRFMFRTLNRIEYKQWVALHNTNALQREEILCEQVVLWPERYKFDAIAKGMAGIPSSLAEVILNKSGFTKEYSIQVI